MIIIANTKIGIKISNVSINKSQAKSDIQKQLTEIGKGLRITIGGTSEQNQMIKTFGKITDSMKETNTELKKMKTNLSNVSSQTNKVNKESETMSRGYLSNLQMITKKVIDWALSVNLVYNSIRALKSGIKELTEIDSTMVSIARVTDLTATEMEKLKITAAEAGQELSKTANEFLSSYAAFSKMGFGEQADELSRIALMFSTVGDMDIEKSQKTLIATMRGMNLESKDSIRIMDSLNNVANKNATSVTELSSGLQKYASTAKTANMNLDETVALLGGLQAASQETGSVVGNALKTITMRITGVTDNVDVFEEDINKAETALRSVGIEVRSSTKEMRPAIEILRETAGQWENLTDVQKAFVAESMGGKMRGGLVKTLMGNFGEVEKQLSESMSSFGSAAREYDVATNSIEAKTKKLQATWTEFWLKSIESDTIKNVIDIIQQLVEWIGGSGGLTTVIGALAIAWASIKFSKWMIGFDNLSIVVATAKETIGKFTMAITNLRNGMNAGRVAALGFQAAMGLLPIVLTGAFLAYQYFSNAEKEAEEKSQSLSKSLDEQAKNIQRARDEYVKISESTADEATKKEQLINIQKTLVDSYGLEADEIDIVNGKYDEQLLKLSKLTIEKANASRAAIAPKIMEAEGAMEQGKSQKITSKSKLQTVLGEDAWEDVARYGEEVDKVIEKYGTLSRAFGSTAVIAEGDLKKMQKDLTSYISDLEKKIKTTKEDTGENKFLKKSLNEATDALSQVNSKVEEYTSTLGQRDALDNFTKSEDKKQNAISKYNELIGLATQRTSENGKQNIKSAEDYKLLASKINENKDAAEKLILTHSLTEEQVKKLAGAFGFTAEEIDYLSGVNKEAVSSTENLAKRQEELEKQLQNTLSSIESNAKALGEYDKEGKFTEETLMNLITKYPELVVHLGNEKNLRNALIKIQKQEQESAVKLYEEKLLSSEQFFTAYLKGHQQMFTNIANAYNLDLNNWKTLAEAKAAIDEKLRKALGEGWAKYYQEGANALYEQAKQEYIEPAAYKETLKQIEKYRSLADTYKTIGKDVTVDFSKFVGDFSKSIQKTASEKGKEKKPKAAKKESEVSAKTIDLLTSDRYTGLSAELNKINNLLEKNKALQEQIYKDDEQSLRKKISLIKQEIALTSQKQDIDHKIENAKRKEASEIEARLKKQGVTFNKEGVITNLQISIDRQTSSLNSIAKNINKTVTTSKAYNLGLPSGGTITSSFGKRKSPTKGASSNHKGIDIGAPTGTSAKSMFGGKVTYAGWMSGYGNTVKVKTAEGIEELFGHLSKIAVKVGQTIAQKAEIGKVGSTGVSTGSHLHYGTQKGGKWVDPLTLLKGSQTITETTVKSNEDVYDKAKTSYDKFMDDIETITKIRTEEIADLQTDWLSLESNKQELSDQIKEIQNIILNNKLELFDKELSVLDDSLDKLNNQFSRLQDNDVEDKFYLLGKKTEVTNDSIKKINSQLDKLNKLVPENSDQVEIIANKIKELNQKLEESVYELDKFKSEFIEFYNTIKAEQIDKAEQAISSYFNTVLKGLEEEIEKYQKKKDLIAESFQTEIDALNTEIETIKKQQESEEKITEELKEQEEHLTKINELTKEISERQEELSNVEKEKNKRILKDGKWIYEADVKRVKELQKEILELQGERYNVVTEKQKEKLEEEKENEYDTRIEINENNIKMFEKNSQDAQEQYDKKIDALQEFIDEERDRYDSFGETTIETQEQLYEILSKLDQSSYSERLGYLNDFISKYNRKYSKLKSPIDKMKDKGGTPIVSGTKGSTAEEVYNEYQYENVRSQQSFREYAESKGLTVGWDSNSKKVTINGKPANMGNLKIVDGSYVGTQEQYDEILKETSSKLSFREYAENKGYTVGWDSTNKKVTLNGKQADMSKLQIVNGHYYGSQKQYDKIIDKAKSQMTFREYAESKGYTVGWDGVKKKVTLNNQAVDMGNIKIVDGHYVGTQRQYDNVINQIGKTKTASFDSEGYTGNWTNGKGKLAMVHPEEWILNKNTVASMMTGNVFDNFNSSAVKKMIDSNQSSVTNSNDIILNNVTIITPDVEDFTTQLRRKSYKNR